ncbi:hypothetical protein BX600DRAFT_13059 [Xylariales sp. PMI_506]|nr:hypothetical protein BX600DRAFT_13059 [Xylariales sp. PMI_506]
MDPDCAICHAPASIRCDCEAKSLEIAVKQAEARVMQSLYDEIRTWVRAHAQDYILEYFRLLTERRKTQHAAYLEQIKQHAYHYYQAPPHPSEIAHAQTNLKRGIDEDWQASVQRYPEVLQYFYSLVDLTVPNDDEPAVKDPPLSAMNGSRKPHRRSMAGALGSEGHYERDHATPARGRTPPIERIGGRTTAPPMGMGFAPPPVGARKPYRQAPPGYYGHPPSPY